MKPVALITGGQKGIGLGIAHALKAAGYDLAIASSSPAEDAAVVNALRAFPEGVRYYQHDLRDVDAVEDLLDHIEAQQGPVVCLVSNAGVPARVRGDMLSIEPENFDFVLDVNLKGAFFLAQATARRMLDQKSDTYRSIIFVTSVSVDMVSIERAEYCVSKAAAGMMSRLFAVRLAEAGIGVFEIRPGIIATDMTAGVREKYDARIADGLIPAKRWGEPSDIGQVVVPMATGQMAYATGAVVPVDGGLSVPRL